MKLVTTHYQNVIIINRFIKLACPIGGYMHSTNKLFILILVSLIFSTTLLMPPYSANSRTEGNIVYIKESDIVDKIKGSYIGQMAGAAWGTPIEFLYQERFVPDKDIPLWNPDLINSSFMQDDIYVEIPFMETLRTKGLYSSLKDLAEGFRKTSFGLCHANDTGRTNLNLSVDAPNSGHYSYNNNCDDVDWQIESDFIGTVFPCQTGSGTYLSWKIGHIMTYGDGVYGGVFVSAMHSGAFTASNIDDIVNTGISSVPKDSLYRKVLDDVMSWKSQGKSWKENWRLLNAKWGGTDRCPDGQNSPFNIDAKMNGAYVLIGLLYGDGDFEKSMQIALQCGQDSDCNASTVGGILGNWLGASKIPDKWKSALKENEINFYCTNYNFNQVVNLNTNLARQAVKLNGGTITNGIWKIKVQNASPIILEQWPKKKNEIPNLSAVVSGKGLSIILNASANDRDGILEYQWHFGDLSYADGADLVHTYKSPGTYEVTCYVTDKTGNTAFKAFNVKCSGNPDTPITVTPIEFKAPPSPYMTEKSEPQSKGLSKYWEKLKVILQNMPMMGR